MRDSGAEEGTGLIEVRLPKCRVFLTTNEMIRLLQQDPELFARAFKRGKRILRARNREKGRVKLYERI